MRGVRKEDHKNGRFVASAHWFDIFSSASRRLARSFAAIVCICKRAAEGGK